MFVHVHARRSKKIYLLLPPNDTPTVRTTLFRQPYHGFRLSMLGVFIDNSIEKWQAAYVAYA